MRKFSTIGMDIAKSVFQVHAVDAEGHVVVKRRVRRGEVLKFFAGVEPCLVGIEACGSAHHWGRELRALGHEVRLLPPSYVKPYVKRGKTDAADAEAICEAVMRPSMRFVPVKSLEAQAAMAAHRTREMLVKHRTMLINLMRSQLCEFGVVAAKGREGVRELIGLVRDPQERRVPEPARQMLLELVGALEALAPRIEACEKAIVKAARQDETARRLMSIPGVGAITASALVASVGDPRAFRNGRHFAAWTGMTARPDSSGGKVRLKRISKQGDRYLRKLLVLGATSSLRRAKTADTPLARWTCRLLQRQKPRVVSVALANKTARIAWAVMAKGGLYRPDAAAA